MRNGGARRSMGQVVLTVLAVACSSAGAGVRAPASDEPPVSVTPVASVTRVTDGDTIRVIIRGREERVRFIGIDTPEVPWYGGPGECFGVEAGSFARHRLAGRSVTLVFDVDRRDRYGRLLAYVYLDDELFNLTLLRAGYARADPVRPNLRLVLAFARAEAEARSSGRGLWSACR